MRHTSDRRSRTSPWGVIIDLMRFWQAAAPLAILFLGLQAHATAASDADTGLPPGSNLDADAIVNPREVFHSEALHGRKSYLSNLGNLLFNSPLLPSEHKPDRCELLHDTGASSWPAPAVPPMVAIPMSGIANIGFGSSAIQNALSGINRGIAGVNQDAAIVASNGLNAGGIGDAVPTRWSMPNSSC